MHQKKGPCVPQDAFGPLWNASPAKKNVFHSQERVKNLKLNPQSNDLACTWVWPKRMGGETALASLFWSLHLLSLPHQAPVWTRRMRWTGNSESMKRQREASGPQAAIGDGVPFLIHCAFVFLCHSALESIYLSKDRQEETSKGERHSREAEYVLGF